jgi:membrane-bound metal-dependent hydrolase YbcI (DUF457 family)
MIVGHFAAALAAKHFEPRLSIGTLTAAALWLDMIWPVLVLCGVERVRIDPGNTRFTPIAFDHYPWSHSLAMTVVWAGLGAMVFRKRSARASAVVAGVVLSHWCLDLVTHRADLPLWPFGATRLGLGLWNSIAGTFAVEGALFAAALYAYTRVDRPHDATGRWSLYGLVTLLMVMWIAGPAMPPPANVTVVAVSAGLGIWAVALWAAWIDRHRTESY